MNLSVMSDQRLKSYKRSLYIKRQAYICECCGEIQIDDREKYLDLSQQIKLISIEQMSRKENKV